MKRSLIIIFTCILGLQSCTPKLYKYTYSAQVSFLNKDEAGTITLNSKGFGKNDNAAVLDAQENAFNIILFKGIPGTEMNVPLIENENSAKAKFEEYFNVFFKNGFYHKFLMSSALSEAPYKVKRGTACSVDLKINVNALRIDLEQNNIIRKFGF